MPTFKCALLVYLEVCFVLRRCLWLFFILGKHYNDLRCCNSLFLISLSRLFFVCFVCFLGRI